MKKNKEMAEQYFSYTVYVPDQQRNTIIIPVTLGVLPPFSALEGPEKKRVTLRALIDTGASGVSISKRFALQHQLQEVSKAAVRFADGVRLTAGYYVDLVLPNGVTFNDTLVTEFAGSPDFEVIIGMKILNKGDVSITNARNHTVFSFRMPPGPLPIDYEKM